MFFVCVESMASVLCTIFELSNSSSARYCLRKILNNFTKKPVNKEPDSCALINLRHSSSQSKFLVNFAYFAQYKQ